jgi:hypothetical protein
VIERTCPNKPSTPALVAQRPRWISRPQITLARLALPAKTIHERAAAEQNLHPRTRL